MLSLDCVDYPGGTEYRILLSPLARELIRAGVLVVGVGLLILIYCLI